MPDLDLDSKYSIVQNTIYNTNTKNEALIMTLDDSDEYFQINGLAAKIYVDFANLPKGIVLKEFFQKCLEKFTPPSEKFRNDFYIFFEKLHELKLITRIED